MTAFLIWLIISGTVFGLTVLFYRKFIRRKIEYNSALDKNIVVGLALVVLIVFASPFYYEFPDIGFSKVVTFENGKIVYHPFGTFTIGKDYSNLLTKPVYVTSGLTFLTQNPKVRKLNYSIWIKVVDPEKFYANIERRKKDSTDDFIPPFVIPDAINLRKISPLSSTENVHSCIVKIIAYHVAEFNNAFSGDLAQFYNPLNLNQQKIFKELFEPWLNEKIKGDGLMASVGDFSVE